LERFKDELAKIGATERDALVRQRVGQDIFRDALMTYWRSTCPMTGITDPELLRASHIIRWSECPSDAERLNVHNGLLLSSLWDAAFDTGLISFDEVGRVLAARELSRAARAELRIEESRPLALVDATQERMAWHRENIFRRR
jgi:predicted restriction endonuclease